MNASIKMKSSLIAAAVITAASLASVNAHAGGFLGDIINGVIPGLGTQLDAINHAAGNPVDHAIAAAANTVVPGSQVAIEAAWALQRGGISSGPTVRANPDLTRVPPRAINPPLPTARPYDGYPTDVNRYGSGRYGNFTRGDDRHSYRSGWEGGRGDYRQDGVTNRRDDRFGNRNYTPVYPRSGRDFSRGFPGFR